MLVDPSERNAVCAGNTSAISTGFSHGAAAQPTSGQTDRNTLSGKLAAERQGLRLNSQHLARLNNFDCVNRSRDERHEILQGIACATEHDDSQFPFGEILLELKISIPRHEDGEADGFSGIEKLSVL